jgi:hypothetical protein
MANQQKKKNLLHDTERVIGSPFEERKNNFLFKQTIH